MKSLGMTVEETGIINSVSSVAAVFAPFFLGLIADKVGNFKVLNIQLIR
jgi:sugar phosphate permease